MEITCLIPTCGNRPNTLKKAVDSIEASSLVSDIKVLVNRDGWLNAVNRVSGDITGAMLLAADDMRFHPGTIEYAVNVMEEHYPGGDGVIGFNQVTLESFCEAGFVLVGREFLKRFPGKKIYCPDYQHYFADTELHRFAKKAGRFTFLKETAVDHWHFSVTGEMDDTARKSRVKLSIDKSISEERMRRGYLWGEDFNLLKGES